MEYYRLHIHSDGSKATYEKITELLRLKPCDYGGGDSEYNIWIYEAIPEEKEAYFDFINVFLDMLEPNFERLYKLGVSKSDISFWFLYEYDQQCNMEFEPANLKRLGDNGITLCISCWENSEFPEESTDA